MKINAQRDANTARAGCSKVRTMTRGTLLKGTLKIGERWDPAPSSCGCDWPPKTSPSLRVLPRHLASPPARCKHTNPQTGPITIHCAAASWRAV